VPGNILAITNAYICYKLFVFRTKGNILKEYLRFYVVYGGTMVLGFILMFCFVDGLKLNPIVAQCLGVPITIMVSFFSHRGYSFRRRSGSVDSQG
jgi:putative flippase GtrA